MMKHAPPAKIGVFCVDDNPLVLEALRLQFGQAEDMQWSGAAEHAESMIAKAAKVCPDIVLLDIDMPGKDAFDAIGELVQLCPETRVLMYSGLVRRDLVDRAIEAGAWGYVAKADRGEELLEAIRAVASGSLGFSASIQGILEEP